jgi:uncharacterized protein YndB with AHSA1/START domain
MASYGSRSPVSTVTASIDIAAAPTDVWAVVMDPARLGDWVTIHRKLIHHDDGPPRIGYQMDQRIHLRGVSVDVHWRLVECEPSTRATWEGRGPARSRARIEYSLRDAPEGATHFDYRNEFHPALGPVGALASRVVAGGLPEREAIRTLDRLRAILES